MVNQVLGSRVMKHFGLAREQSNWRERARGLSSINHTLPLMEPLQSDEKKTVKIVAQIVTQLSSQGGAGPTKMEHDSQQSQVK